MKKRTVILDELDTKLDESSAALLNQVRQILAPDVKAGKLADDAVATAKIAENNLCN